MWKNMFYVYLFSLISSVIGKSEDIYDDDIADPADIVTSIKGHKVPISIGVGGFLLVLCIVFGLWKCLGRNKEKKNEVKFVVKRKRFGRMRGVSREDSFRHLQIYNSVHLSDAAIPDFDHLVQDPEPRTTYSMFAFGKQTAKYRIANEEKKKMSKHEKRWNQKEMEQGKSHKIENEPLTENDDFEQIIPDHSNFILKSPRANQEKVEDFTKAGESGEEPPNQIGHNDLNNDCCVIPLSSADEIDGTTTFQINNRGHVQRPIHFHSLENPDLLLRPRTHKLVVSNGPWRTDIPPTPDGFPPTPDGFPPSASSTQRQYELRRFQVDVGGFHDCRSDVTRDLITCSSPEGRVAGNDIVVTPVVEQGPVTRIIISR